MQRSPRSIRLTSFLLLALVLCPVLSAENGDAGTVILDTTGFWRWHFTLRKPVVRAGDGFEVLQNALETEPPAGNWIQPDFDDSHWQRSPGRILRGYESPQVGLLCVRGKFTVTDPAAVKGLSLSLDYYGGAVAYVNGKEIARGHLPEREGPEEVAEDYPDEAFVLPDGSLLFHPGWSKPKPQQMERLALRQRKLADVRVPPGLLRKGVNVLAVEIHRAAYFEKMPDLLKKCRPHLRSTATWMTCDLLGVQLKARSPNGVVPNIVRPQGFQAWNSDVLAGDFDLDFGEANEKLRPIRILGTPNGAFTGKVMLGSTDPIRKLHAAVTDFTGKNGETIPASNVQVRYALASSQEYRLGNHENNAQYRYTAEANLFDALVETAPEEIPVRVKKRHRRNLDPPTGITPVFGAVVPVWLKVNVPRDAHPGDYEAKLTISAEGVPAFDVPVRLRVCRFALPDPNGYHTFVDLMHSPESVALEYEVPLYSDRHFERLGRSLQIMGEIGNKTLYIPLICETNMGNEQSMVRWIPEGEDSYGHDFTVLERYLDLVMEHMGKPRIVCLYVWDIFLDKMSWDGRQSHEGEGVPVSRLDPNTGEVTTIQLPRYGDPKIRESWKKLMDGLMMRLKTRGLDKNVMLGLLPDSYPAKTTTDLFRELLGDVGWMRHRHGGGPRLRDGSFADYLCLVFTPRYPTVEDPKSMFGWKDKVQEGRKYVMTQFQRTHVPLPIVYCRFMGERNIQGNQNGFGRFGVDFWRVLKDKRGRKRGDLKHRYPKSAWQNLDWMLTALTHPGPKGALTTVRFEMLREGVQECEARILVERAFTDEALRRKLGEPLAGRCRALSDERTRMTLVAAHNLKLGYDWYVTSGWQSRSQKLYELAAEVADRLQAGGPAAAR